MDALISTPCNGKQSSIKSDQIGYILKRRSARIIGLYKNPINLYDIDKT